LSNSVSRIPTFDQAGLMLSPDKSIFSDLPAKRQSRYNFRMKTKTLVPSTEGAIWERIVDPGAGDLTREAAQTLLQFDFNPADRRRMDELAEKASTWALTPAERKAAETYNRVAHLLALLQSKVRQSLRRKKRS
jgi:hypothetical protein